MGLINEPVTSIKLFLVYTKFNPLTDGWTEIEDCYSDNIKMFRDCLLKYPGLGGAVGYGRKIRDDLVAKIILEWTDKAGYTKKEFKDVFELARFLDDHPPLGKKLEYEKKR